MATIPNIDIWREFIQIYKELPELWKVKLTAWQKLLEKYKEIESSANIDNLKKVINNIRTCFRRELKNVGRSADLEAVYEPRLWYFKELEFLRDQETQILGSEQRKEATETVKNVNKKRKTLGQHLADKQVLLKHVDHLQNNGKEEAKDETSIYAESWAISYRKLSVNQKIFAKKAIADILVLGLLEKLTLNTVPTPSSFKFDSRVTSSYSTRSASSFTYAPPY